MSEMQLRLTGSGGQGVIMATIIMADCALRSGKNVAQSQAYGPEARGGMCKAEVLISDGEIGFTKVTNPTFLMCLTQLSLDNFTKTIDENCTVLFDSSLSLPENIKCGKAYSAPILATAKEVVGKAFTANIVAVSVINKILGIASSELVKEVVSEYIPRGTEEINFKALAEGEKIEIKQII